MIKITPYIADFQVLIFFVKFFLFFFKQIFYLKTYLIVKVS
ncbi:MAG: hypothetical protein RLZZ358_1460 [Bacteroidota bacterium]|jgi:hypothetical protein